MEQKINQELLDTANAYLRGQLKGEELDQFRAKLEKNPVLKEEVEIQKKLLLTLDSNSMDWEIIENPEKVQNAIELDEYQRLSAKIKAVEQHHRSEQISKTIPQWYKISKWGLAAALISILLVFVFLMNKLVSTNSPHYDYAQWVKELPSFQEKSDEVIRFARAESLFRDKNYISAIEEFKQIGTRSKYHPYSLMYIGASYDLLGDNNQALETFLKLSAIHEFEESGKGLWYASLIYLKQGKDELAIQTLEQIIQRKKNYYYEEAVELLKELR